MVLGFRPVFSAISETVNPFTFQLSEYFRKKVKLKIKILNFT
jgi:hypothetical protein